MSRSDWVLQRLADLADVRVQRAADSEATAIGAAMIGGLAAGFWSSVDELPEVAVDRVVEPSLDPAARSARREQWAAALALAAGWQG
jgi:glycerol kinase